MTATTPMSACAPLRADESCSALASPEPWEHGDLRSLCDHLTSMRLDPVRWRLTLVRAVDEAIAQWAMRICASGGSANRC